MAFRRKKRRKDLGSRNSRAIRVMGAFVIACLLCVTGFVLRGNNVFLERMGMESLSVDVEQNPGMTVAGDTYNSLSARIAEVQGVLEQNSLDAYDLDDATHLLVADMLKETGDPYARYYDEEAYAARKVTEADEVFGVGILFGDYKNQAYAVDVIPGSSAQVAGVESGDFVVAIDGERKDEGWTLSDTLKNVEREDGSSVAITWRRPESLEAAGGDEYTVTLTCANVAQKNVTSKLRSKKVGYVKVLQLGRNSASLVSEAVKNLTGKGATSFVLDLRDCPGGYLTEAISLASLFQGNGVVVQIKTHEGTSARSATGNAITTAPLAVIVNGNTAAAAEVVAASLQDSNRAVIVGQSTMGKGTVQITRELSFGGAISYTAAEYITPKGRSLNDSGVSPDILASASSENDTALILAAGTASSRVKD